jgi:hypothetical protein
MRSPYEGALGKAIGLGWQRVEVRPIQLSEQHPAGDTEPPNEAFVEPCATNHLARRDDQAFAVTVAWVGGQPAAASLAFERGATAVAFDVHLEDGGVMNEAVDEEHVFAALPSDPCLESSRGQGETGQVRNFGGGLLT